MPRLAPSWPNKLIDLIKIAQSILGRYGVAMIRTPFPRGASIDVLGLLLDRHPLLQGPQFQLVQIGANDGTTDDPVRHHLIARKWSAVLVEPVPSLFEKLKHSYSGVPNVHLANCAVATSDGPRTIHYISPEAPLPQYAQQLASFDKNVMLKQRRTIKDIEPHIRAMEVPGRTVASLFEAYSVKHVNLLVTDTEGFDFHVLRMVFDLGVLPDMICFEYTHMSPMEKHTCGQILMRNGYRYIAMERDAIAMRSCDGLNFTPTNE